MTNSQQLANALFALMEARKSVDEIGGPQAQEYPAYAESFQHFFDAYNLASARYEAAVIASVQEKLRL